MDSDSAIFPDLFSPVRAAVTQKQRSLPHICQDPVVSHRPFLLEQKCNGTTAGLGYLEISVDCVRTVNPIGGMAQFLC